MNRFAANHPEDWEAREEAMVDAAHERADVLRDEAEWERSARDQGSPSRPSGADQDRSSVRRVDPPSESEVEKLERDYPELAEPVPKSFSQILAGLFKGRV